MIRTDLIADPPEKAVLMYQAVMDLLQEGKDVSSLKVQDITVRAGIGKGTAYEYFSSKEELLTCAVTYECYLQILLLRQELEAVPDFRSRIDRIQSWIKKNRQKSEMLRKMADSCLPEVGGPAGEQRKEAEIPAVAGECVRNMIGMLMRDARAEGVIREENEGKCLLTFLSAMMEYALVSFGPEKSFQKIMPEEELRDFIYEGILRRLA